MCLRIILQRLKQPFLGIQSQVGFSLVGIGPVAFKATVRQDRADMEIKIDNLGNRFSGVRRTGALAEKKDSRCDTLKC